jgi:hypothetical protein
MAPAASSLVAAALEAVAGLLEVDAVWMVDVAKEVVVVASTALPIVLPRLLTAGVIAAPVLVVAVRTPELEAAAAWMEQISWPIFWVSENC